ncbi:(2Fe-2S)-binding protein [Actinacidiphila glaucinigra]|uniref:(2Fe-2S)-binding protein n=1 Tax=Actinacidiphila glaucinigra TaxID=235986 RepID=UPI002E37CC49|nr:(2Fe-2S)-binding protein [Actinacidiphila glaucinigra]
MGALTGGGGPGPFFAVRTGPGEPRAEGFVPLAEVYAGRPSPALTARVAEVGRRLGTPERRVAASLAQQGLAARLWSVALGPAALSDRMPDLSGGRLWWHPGRSAPDELWLPDDAPRVPAGRLREDVLLGHLVPLCESVHAVSGVAPGLLWGNAASALAGTLRVLHSWCLGEGARPGAAARAVALAEELMADPLLRDAGGLRLTGPGAPAYVRRNCCLYYRVPGGGLCGDCALR